MAIRFCLDIGLNQSDGMVQFREVLDALIDVLAVMIIGFVSDIVNVFASLMTALEFPVPPPLRESGCSDAFGC